MATYREIHGKAIKSLDTDPSATTDEGQIWYNTASNTFKSIVNLEAWSSTSPLAQDRYGAGGLGSQTAAVIAGGRISPPNAVQSISEEYNGTGFVSGGSLNTARFNLGACGTEPAGLAFAGNEPSVSDKTETYNGSSWTAGNTMNTARAGVGGCGTQTAALAVGGPAGSTASESFNGSTWTATPSINTGRVAGRAMGTSTAAIYSGGEGAAPSYTLYANTESFDGSSWSEVSDMGAAKYLMGQSGSSTAAIVFGGRISSTNQTATEKWDGTSWTTSPATLGTAFGYGGAAGSPSNTSALQAGSLGPSPATASSAFSQEYTVSANVITAAAWSSTPAMSTGRYGGASGGTPTAAWYATGYKGSPGYTSDTEEYDGTSWTAGGSIADGTTQSTGSCGTLTAGLKMGGTDGSPPYTETEEYNGSAWTAVPANLNATPTGTSGCGTQTSALYTRGRPSTVNEEYNGTSWTTANTIGTTNRSGCNSGTQTAALYLGGEQPPGPYLKLNDEYDGTNWTAGGSLVIPQGISSNSGPSSDTMAASGYTTDSPWGPGNIANTQIYDGTAWATSANVGIVRSSGGSSNRGCAPGSSSDAAFVFGGSPVSPAKTGELFASETSAVNVKTLTQS